MKKENGMTLPKDIIVGVDKNGNAKTITLYHDLQDLKSKENFEEFTSKKGNANFSYDEYLDLVAKLAFTKDFMDLRKDYTKKVDTYLQVRDVVAKEKIDDLEELYKETPSNYEEMRRIESASRDFAKAKCDEYSIKIESLNQKISLINFVAKKKNIRLVEKDNELNK